jgi:hypothetical protein
MALAKGNPCQDPRSTDGSEIDALLEPLVSYIAATDDPRAVLFWVMSRLMKLLDEIISCAEDHIEEFKSQRA